MSTAVSQLGPFGVFLLMVPESACVPLPSELTLLSAGFGVHQGWFSFTTAVVAATAGNVVGSSIAYWLGRRQVLSKLPLGGGALSTAARAPRSANRLHGPPAAAGPHLRLAARRPCRRSVPALRTAHRRGLRNLERGVRPCRKHRGRGLAPAGGDRGTRVAGRQRPDPGRRPVGRLPPPRRPASIGSSPAVSVGSRR
jgi:hypothetical protein